MRNLVLLTTIFLTPLLLRAQSQFETDTDSINHICDVSLEIISVKKGEEVNWDRFLNLFLPEGVLIWTGMVNDTARSKTIPVTDMKTYNGYTQTGFNEKVLKRVVHQFGQVATVFESYEATTPDGSYKSRGVNIYQLIYKEGRWWIASITWCDESETLKLTAEME